MSEKKCITISYRSAAIDVRFADDEWSYRHPQTGSWVHEPRQVLQGWSEQDPEEQAEWDLIVQELHNPEFFEWMDQAEDGDTIYISAPGRYLFSVPPPDRYEIEGYEVAEKRVTAFGNSCHIAMPRSWGGCTVKIVRISPKK